MSAYTPKWVYAVQPTAAATCLRMGKLVAIDPDALLAQIPAAVPPEFRVPLETIKRDLGEAAWISEVPLAVLMYTREPSGNIVCHTVRTGTDYLDVKEQISLLSVIGKAIGAGQQRPEPVTHATFADPDRVIRALRAKKAIQVRNVCVAGELTLWAGVDAPE